MIKSRSNVSILPNQRALDRSKTTQASQPSIIHASILQASLNTISEMSADEEQKVELGHSKTEVFIHRPNRDSILAVLDRLEKVAERKF